MQVLDEHRSELVARERTLLEKLARFLSSIESPASDVALVRQAMADVEEFFLLVTVGEYNAGKSAFINALIGKEVAEEGVTPTTNRITILKYSEKPSTRDRSDGILERGYPSEFLRDVAIVDTPGTNAILRHHEELSRSFVPRADLVLFITSADRPYTESEREYLELIRDWGKKIVLIVNKVDLVGKEEETETLRRFVQEGVRNLLGITPPVFMVSARLAQRAKTAKMPMEREALLRASGFDKLEGYIFGLLDEEGRVRLKLESPLGVAVQLVQRYDLAVRERMNLLEQDFRMAENVDAQLELYRADMRRDFTGRMAEIENLIHAMTERGDAWFEDNIRLGRFFDLLKRERIQEEFQVEVVADTVELIDQRVQELIDWMVDRNLKQWRSIVEYVNRRREARYDEHLIGDIGAGFEYNRSQLLESVGKTAATIVKGYNRDYESQQIAQSIQSAVQQSAVAQVGAIGLGLGSAVAMAASATALDVTGLLAAGAIAGIGLFIIPNKRRTARAQFRERTELLRKRLAEVVRRQFEAELDRSVERINEAIAPYTRFVRTEYTRMSDARSTLKDLTWEVETLRKDVAAPAVAAS